MHADAERERERGYEKEEEGRRWRVIMGRGKRFKLPTGIQHREATFGTALKKFCLQQGRETSGLVV